MNKLIEILLARGYKIHTHDELLFFAYKPVQTINGERDINMCIFLRNPQMVRPSYLSEGRNILEAFSFSLDANIQKELDLCEKMVNDSYAVRLLRLTQK